MTVIVDTGPLVALADRRDPMQRAVHDLLATEPGLLVVPAPVTAEADHLIGRRVGARSRRLFLRDLAAGRFHVACLEDGECATVERLDRAYEDLDLRLADLSVVVLADSFHTNRIVTFDERDFRPVRPLRGGSFEILPADGRPA